MRFAQKKNKERKELCKSSGTQEVLFLVNTPEESFKDVTLLTTGKKRETDSVLCGNESIKENNVCSEQLVFFGSAAAMLTLTLAAQMNDQQDFFSLCTFFAVQTLKDKHYHFLPFKTHQTSVEIMSVVDESHWTWWVQQSHPKPLNEEDLLSRKSSGSLL